MKRILITVDDEMAKVLAQSPNQSETVRQALKVYQEHITTDTVAGIKQGFLILNKEQKEVQARLIELYEKVESLETLFNEMSSR